MSIRQDKISNEIQRELSVFFQRESATVCLGSMVSVTTVRVTSDLSVAKVYISIFAGPPVKDVVESIKTNVGKAKTHLSKALNGMRKIPNLVFYVDDSLDYAEKIDELLKE